MKLPKVYMYSGQGSQYYNMGNALYSADSQFKLHVNHLNDIASQFLGRSLLEEIFRSDRKPSDLFEHQVLSSMAIYLIESALTRSLKDYDLLPDKLLGSSLGLLAAFTAANCFDEEDGFRFIKEMMTCYISEAKPGGMIAVHEDLEVFEGSFLLKSNCELAGINFHSSFVLSMPQSSLNLVEDYLRDNNCIYFILPVPFAYHSIWMNHLESKIVEYFSQISLRPATLPVFCCSHANALGVIDKKTFWTAIRQPLLLPNTINAVEAEGNHHYIDLGPSGSLATAIKYCLKDGSSSQNTTILSPFKKNYTSLKELQDLTF